MKKIVIGIISCCLVGIAGCGIGVIVLNNKNLNNSNEIKENENIFENSNNNKKDENKIDKYVGNGIKSSTASRIAYKGSNAVYYKNYGDGNQIIKLDDKGNKTQLFRYSPDIEFEKDKILYLSNSHSLEKNIYAIELNNDYSEISRYEFENKKTIESAKLFIGIINNDIYYNNVEEIFDSINDDGITSKYHYESSLYKYNLNGDDALIKEGIGELYVDKDKIYYNKISTSESSVFSKMYEPGLYVSDVNFNNEKKIIENDDINDLVVNNDSIFYLKTGKLYKNNLDGNNENLIIDENIEIFEMTNNYIYYKINLDSKLYRVDINGKNETQIISNNVRNFDLVDEYIYYIDSTNSKITRMKNNGSKIEIMTIDGDI